MRKSYLIFEIVLTVIFGSLLSGCRKDEGQVPVIETNEIVSVTQTSAIAGGIITLQGSSAAISKGICWSIEEKPTVKDSIRVDEIGIDTIKCTITGLTPDTKYFVRPYAINSSGTGYGAEKSFTTEPATIPLIITTGVSSVSQTAAISGGEITSDGESTIVSRGVCWSTAQNPTTSDQKTTDGSGIGTFSSVISGLTGNTTYFIRAYSTNSVGTSYGNQIIFKTSPVIPVVLTLSSSSISAISAIIGGKITSNGGDSVIFRGVCWSLSPNPTIIDYRTADGIGTGTFNSKIGNLFPSTTYYVRAYATNISGTAYGDQISFTTLDGIPQLSLTTTFAIASTCVTFTGNISTDGGAEIVKKGVCISLSHNPTVLDVISSDTAKALNINGHFEGLLVNTIYYSRTYITNAFGTYYGPESEFETLERISDIEGNIYNIVSIGTQVWMAQNLNTRKYNDGTEIFNRDYSASSWFAYNNEAGVLNEYGLFYSRNAVATKKICPVGWHIPSSIDWGKLIDFLGGSTSAVGKLQEVGYEYWPYLNSGATNESCFTAIPGGYYGAINQQDNKIHTFGHMANWWLYPTSDAWGIRLSGAKTTENIFFDFDYYIRRGLPFYIEGIGFSARCIKN